MFISQRKGLKIRFFFSYANPLKADNNILPVQVKVAVQYMRRIIQKRAKFDIMSLNCLQVCVTLLLLKAINLGLDVDAIMLIHE